MSDPEPAINWERAIFLVLAIVVIAGLYKLAFAIGPFWCIVGTAGVFVGYGIFRWRYGYWP